MHYRKKLNESKRPHLWAYETIGAWLRPQNMLAVAYEQTQGRELDCQETVARTQTEHKLQSSTEHIYVYIYTLSKGAFTLTRVRVRVLVYEFLET